MYIFVIVASYLGGIRLLRLLDEGLRSSGHGVSSGCRRAILRRAHKLDSTTLDYDIRGWWKILRITDRVAITQKPGLFPVQGVDLSATEGKSSIEEHFAADGASHQIISLIF